MSTMEIHNLNANLSPKRKEIIERILNLSEEQFELLLTLYSQQETESSQACPAPNLASA